MTRTNGPQLFINYSPELELCGTFARAQEYEVASTEYFFEVKCRFRHSTGYFEYFANDLCFELDNFAHLAEQLQHMRRGTADSAALKNVGEMFVSQLDREGRQLRLRLRIREYVPQGELASLSLAADADYDLFVNKLGRTVEEFLADLHSWTSQVPLPIEITETTAFGL